MAKFFLYSTIALGLATALCYLGRRDDSDRLSTQFKITDEREVEILPPSLSLQAYFLRWFHYRLLFYATLISAALWRIAQRFDEWELRFGVTDPKNNEPEI